MPKKNNRCFSFQVVSFSFALVVFVLFCAPVLYSEGKGTIPSIPTSDVTWPFSEKEDGMENPFVDGKIGAYDLENLPALPDAGFGDFVYDSTKVFTNLSKLLQPLKQNLKGTSDLPSLVPEVNGLLALKKTNYETLVAYAVVGDFLFAMKDYRYALKNYLKARRLAVALSETAQVKNQLDQRVAYSFKMWMEQKQNVKSPGNTSDESLFHKD